MRLVSKVGVSLFSMMLMASFSLAGTITGTVKGKDGSNASGVEVRLMKAPEGDKKQKGGELLADKGKGKGEKGKGPEALQTTTTDSDGKFEFKNVEDGNYIVTAGNRQAGVGRATAKVMGDSPVEVTIELKDMPAKGEKGGKGEKGEN